MSWNSPAEFFAMGGYALYVWSSFGMCAVLLALEPALVRHRHQAAMGNLRRQLRAEQLDGEKQ